MNSVNFHWREGSWGAEYFVTKFAKAFDLKKVHTLEKLTSPNPIGKVVFVEVELPLILKLISKFGGAIENCYLYLSKMYREKNIIGIVQALKELKILLKIVGSQGNIFKNTIKSIKKCKNTKYISFDSEKDKIELPSECKAVVFNAINDFGIVLIEANAGKLCIFVSSCYLGCS